MTVVYAHVVGGKGFGNFLKLLFWWRGSIYKLVLPEMLIYLLMFYAISGTYRSFLAGQEAPDDAWKLKFHELVAYCRKSYDTIPLQFMLGFYVSLIVTRWWNEYMSTPWLDTLALIVATSVHGHDDRGRMMRRTIMRYCNLTLNMTLSMVSSQVRVRFPTMQHMVEAGFLVPHEKLIIDHLNEKMEGPKYWAPIVWAGAIASRARKEGRIRDDIALYHVIKELARFRSMCGDLLSYDWVTVPIVYTQVVTLATYIYFLATLFAKQFIQGDADVYIPLFHFVEFFFVMGWLKVAETMINPWGSDDDDFEANWLVDRNITLSYLVVDEMNTEFPEMVRDQYWDEVVPEDIPYTQAAMKYKKDIVDTYMGSAALSESPQDLVADFLSAGKESVGQGSGTARHKTSLQFSLPFHVYTDQNPRKHSKNDDNNTINYGQSERMQKNTGIGTSLGATESVGHLYERNYVPRKKDSDEDLQKRVIEEEPSEEQS